jgi:hypothetical protein
MVRYPSSGTSNLTRSKSSRGIRTDASYRRRSGGREPRPVILIVCEGEKTEPSYFKAISHSRRISATTEIVPRALQPTKVVQTAERKRIEFSYDRIWCVFDCDEHADFELAIAEAKRKGFYIAHSNPCIELWYLLHYEEQNSHITKEAVAKRLKRHLLHYSKSTPVYEELQPRQDRAFLNAAKQEEHHRNSGRAATDNPSTSVNQLVEYLNSLSS